MGRGGVICLVRRKFPATSSRFTKSDTLGAEGALSQLDVQRAGGGSEERFALKSREGVPVSVEKNRRKLISCPETRFRSSTAAFP